MLQIVSKSTCSGIPWIGSSIVTSYPSSVMHLQPFSLRKRGKREKLTSVPGADGLARAEEELQERVVDHRQWL